MIGITVSTDQLRRAPAAVRQWIEGEVASALAMQLVTPAPDHHQGLALCSAEEVHGIFCAIRSVVPAVSVFLELGHQGVGVAGGAIEAYRLSDLMNHARLGSADQLMTLLDMINGALQSIRGTNDVSLYGLDGRGHCFVAAQTRQNIGDLWKHLINDSYGPAERPAAPPDGNVSGPQPVMPLPESRQTAA